jgi:hypothetical protein
MNISNVSTGGYSAADLQATGNQQPAQGTNTTPASAPTDSDGDHDHDHGDGGGLLNALA